MCKWEGGPLVLLEFYNFMGIPEFCKAGADGD